MENPVSPNTGPQSDEIDLGQLFQMIGRGLKKLFKAFLGLFIYLKRNIIKLGILGIVGLAIGFGLNQIVTKKHKTEVIVKPNSQSKNYLYDVVSEIQANARARDTVFFSSLDINVEDLKGFKIEIVPVGDKVVESNIDDDLKYLELLEKFRNDDLVTDVVRTEILAKSTLNHRITFSYNKGQDGKGVAKKLLNYINSNDYFTELAKINSENAQDRIKQDQNLIAQIDGLVAKYSEKMESTEQKGEGRIVLDTEEQLDITGLLGLKNGLIRDIERKRLEIQGQKEAVRIINFGNTQEIQESFFGKSIVFIPLILITFFFIIDILKYLNRKAKEMQVQ